MSALITLLAGMTALSLFAWRSLHRTAPLLDLRLFTNRIYAAAARESSTPACC